MSSMQPLRRLFDIDVSQCPRCGGEVRVIATVTEPNVIARILAHLQRPEYDTPAPRGPRPCNWWADLAARTPHTVSWGLHARLAKLKGRYALPRVGAQRIYRRLPSIPSTTRRIRPSPIRANPPIRYFDIRPNRRFEMTILSARAVCTAQAPGRGVRSLRKRTRRPAGQCESQASVQCTIRRIDTVQSLQSHDDRGAVGIVQRPGRPPDDFRRQELPRYVARYRAGQRREQRSAIQAELVDGQAADAFSARMNIVVRRGGVTP